MKKEVKTKWYHFRQNNSGGFFYTDDERGIGPHVWIEALSPEDANGRAENLGIYFDGVERGNDCECCGDRWDPASSYRSSESPTIYDSFLGAFYWHDTIYIHDMNGKIHRIKKDTHPNKCEI